MLLSGGAEQPLFVSDDRWMALIIIFDWSKSWNCAQVLQQLQSEHNQSQTGGTQNSKTIRGMCRCENYQEKGLGNEKLSAV